MTTSIDERVVSMQFRNSSFLSGIATTINALANLKKSLNLDSSKKGLDGVNQAMSKMPPSQLAAGIEGISTRFLALSTIGITALANITNSAIAAGTQLLKSLTIDPIKMGLEEYETGLNSVQTIMANTGLEGQKGLDKVNKKLQELNEYADQTIYNFSQMAKNIGTFTAAGVDLDTSTSAIKGIANLAAISGSNAEQASTAMYQLSQSLASGKVSLEDWNSVVNAGLGGKVFQEALKETARVHGVAVDSIIKEQGSFRNSLQEGWVTSEILTETLSKFTGDLTEAQLKTMGYNQDQIKEIVKMGQTASDAATKVKTMTQLINTLQESVQSSWAQTWQMLFGDFDEARTLFTNVNNVLGEMIGQSGDARNKLISDWSALGGRTVLIEAIGTAFNNIIKVTRPVREAFRDIFPPTTAKQLFEITQGLLNFSKSITLGKTDAENLRRTFSGIFAIFSIVGQLIKGILTTFGRLFGIIGEGSGSFLEFTGSIGDWLVALDEALKKGNGLTKFFEGLATVLALPIALLGALGALISGAFTGFDEGAMSGVDGALERLGARLEPFQAMADLVAAAWGRMGSVLQGVWDFMAPFANAVGEIFSSIGEAITSSVSDGDFDTILDTLNTGLFAALVLGIRKFLSDGSLFSFGGDSGGLVDSIKDIFGGLNDTLGALQANLKSGTLIKIAAAVALLTASVVALSLIDSGKLAKALGAITVMFLQLAGAMALLDAVGGFGIAAKLAPMAAGLILLSTAILILSGAVKILSTMSWEELAKGLGALVVMLAAVAGAVKLMSGAGKGLIGAGIGMIGISVGIGILAGAVALLSNLSWEEMLRGLTGLVVIMGAVAGAMKLMTGALPGAAAMLIVAPAIAVLAGALKIMASMSWEEFAKSMSALAGGLLIIAGALYLMTAALPGAAAMLVVAPALIIMAYALKVMGSMSWEEFGKSMAILASSLGILAVTLTAMLVALPGAAALLVAAAALAVLAPVLILFGNMSWEEIGRGLTMLAATLAIIGIAGAALTPVIPTLLGLGAAILLMGAGMLAAGAGLLAFSIGLSALAVGGAAAVASIIAIVSGLIGLIPMAMNAVAEGIVLMANVIGGAGPQFVVAMTTLMNSLLTSINNVAPKIINTIWNLVILLANRVASGYPQLVNAGLRLITGVLNGIASNIGGIVTAATNIIVNFINALSANLPRITQAGADMVITLIESLAGTINSNAGRMRAAGQSLAFAIVDGMTGGLLSGASSVIGAAADMASSALNAAKDVLGIASPSKEFKKLGRWVNQGFADGLTDGSRRSVRAAYWEMRNFLREVIQSTAQDMKDARERIGSLTEARKKDIEQMKAAEKAHGKNSKAYRKAAKEYEEHTTALRKAEKALATARKENAAAKNANTNVIKNLGNEYKALQRVAGSYEKVTARLERAQDKLSDAIKTRNSYNASIRDQYGDLGQIEGNTLKGFSTSLTAQVKETREFKKLLDNLRKNGLSDALYEELLSRGTDALPLLRSINQGGKAGIKEINKLAGQLGSASKALGSTASKELYQAGVDAARGLVDGLKKQQKALQRQMDKIAGWMVSSIKRRLGIKSPSRVFAEIGLYSVQGLAKGLKDNSLVAEKAAVNVGDKAKEALQKSLRGVSAAVETNLEMRPIVRPVLDLSAVKKEAVKLPSVLPSTRLSVDASSSAARNISSGMRSAVYAREGVLEYPNDRITNIRFEQSNISPKALPPSDIYRNTKNMLALVKGTLRG